MSWKELPWRKFVDGRAYWYRCAGPSYFAYVGFFNDNIRNFGWEVYWKAESWEPSQGGGYQMDCKYQYKSLQSAMESLILYMEGKGV